MVYISPLSNAVGGEITGVDISLGLPDDIFQRVLDAWHQSGVILLRDQTLSKQSLVKFSARFGVPEMAAPQERELNVLPEAPEIMMVSNVIENGRSIGHLGNKEAYWHTDMCYTPVPPIASILYAVEVPPIGGDTGFMNMYEAYDRLPDRLKHRIESLSIKHDRSYTAVGDLRHGYEPVTDVSRSPGALHPIVRQHPITRRVSLYLGRRLNSYVVGLPVAESEALLNELWQYTEAPEIIWHHKWKVGDLLIWDNRCLMHRRDGFDQNSRRVMWRTQIQASAAIRS
jgi:taurine dioxygenase